MLAAASTTTHSSSSLVLLIYVALFALLYFFYLRPRSRRAKEQRNQARQVEVGDRVRTIGGLVATLVERTDEMMTLRTDAGAELQFLPSAIAGRYEPRPVAAPEPEEPADGPSDEDR